MQKHHMRRPFGIFGLLVLFGALAPARAELYQTGDATYGPSAIDITFSWDGNVSDPLTNFEWSTPLSNGAVYGTLTASDVLLWDSSGFPDGITNLAVYLLSGQPLWSEDCTSSGGVVSPLVCEEPGSRIDLNVRDAAVGTYGFQLNRQVDLASLDSVGSGTLVSITPEPSTLHLLSAAGTILIIGNRMYRNRKQSCQRHGTPSPRSSPD